VKTSIVILLLSVLSALAQRAELRPLDFEPLTSLPWKKDGATLDSTLAAIFREPNEAIRAVVLAEYLRQISVRDLGAAFDRCVALEGSQTPDDLVALFLEGWAARDPKGCWKRTKELFRIAGIEHGWLNYDGWTRRPRLTVQDREAIRASKCWLRSDAFRGFPLGVQYSSLSRKERLPILREFADRWFRAFGTWPAAPRDSLNAFFEGAYRFPDRLQRAFEMSGAELRNASDVDHHALGFEIRLRRWLVETPAEAPQVMAAAYGKDWPARPGASYGRSSEPSNELLMLWARADQPGMIRWVEPLDIRKDNLAPNAKGLLMSRIDAATRERWLADAKSANPDDDHRAALFQAWAAWDPGAAFAMAIATGDASLCMHLSNQAAYGPWHGYPSNTSRFGLGFLRTFDFAKLPKSIHDALLEDAYSLMELWGGVDTAAAARFGFDYLQRTNYAPREGLIRLFSGEDLYPDEGGMIDRTFCALRVWAAVKPGEMETWIATIEDAEMRKALRWLLKNPWGTGSEE